jgi:hypothetical protein
MVIQLLLACAGAGRALQACPMLPARSQECHPGGGARPDRPRPEGGGGSRPVCPVLPQRGGRGRQQGRGLQGQAAGAEQRRGGVSLLGSAHARVPQPVPGASGAPGGGGGGGGAGGQCAPQTPRPAVARACVAAAAAASKHRCARLWHTCQPAAHVRARTQPQVVVLTDASLEEAKRVNEVCHAHSPAIAFIRVETRGVFASVFTDFGPSFTVFDVDGERGRGGVCARSGTTAGVGARARVAAVAPAAAAGGGQRHAHTQRTQAGCPQRCLAPRTRHVCVCLPAGRRGAAQRHRGVHLHGQPLAGHVRGRRAPRVPGARWLHARGRALHTRCVRAASCGRFSAREAARAPRARRDAAARHTHRTASW